MQNKVLLAKIDDQQRIIEEQKRELAFLQMQNQQLDDLYVLDICRTERLEEKIRVLSEDIKRLREINTESRLIKELRQKYKATQ